MPNVIHDIRALIPGNRMYSVSARAQFRGAVEATRGHVLTVVHPLYSLPERCEVDITSAVRDRYVMGGVVGENYGDYFFGLNSCLERKNLPFLIFISAGMRDTVEKWLSALSIPTPGVLIQTGESPVPVIDNSEVTWEAVRAFAERLGIKSMAVTGEMYFVFKGTDGVAKDGGCVGLFASNMRELRATIVANLTYPAKTYDILR